MRTTTKEEARDIHRNALCDEEAPSVGMGTQIVALFMVLGLEEDIPELRGYPVVIADALNLKLD